MGHRIISGRIFGYGCDNGTLRKRQFGYIFVEIPGCCCLDTEAPLSQVNGIHIRFQDFLFAHLLFNLESQILFLEFSLDPVVKRLFAYEIGKHIIFDKLLGDRAGSF